jgi:hypothetical protein
MRFVLAGLPVLLLLLAGCADGGPPATGEAPLPPGDCSDALCVDDGIPDEPPADTLEWTWSEGPSLPFGLAEAGFGGAGLGGYLVGGFAGPLGGANTVLLVPAGGDAEVSLPPYPLPVHHAQVAVVGGVPHVFGGYVGGAPNPLGLAGASSAGWPVTAASFKAEGGAWVPIQDLPEPRAAGGAVVLDGLVYLVGGSSDDGHPAPVWAYDPAANGYLEVAPLPVPRDHLNVLVHDGLVYAIAGRDVGAAQVDDLATFEVYNPISGAWTTLPDCPLGRGGQAAGVLAGRIVVAGGERIEGEFTVYDEAHAYDIAAQQWVTLPPMPEARHGGAIVPVEGGLAYLGGATLAGDLAATGFLLSVR